MAALAGACVTGKPNAPPNVYLEGLIFTAAAGPFPWGDGFAGQSAPESSTDCVAGPLFRLGAVL